MEEDNQQLTKKQRRTLRKEEQALERAKEQRSGAFKRAMLWVGIIVVVALFVAWVAKLSKPNSSAVPTVWTQGSDAPELSIVEYSDFQCPACAAYYPVVKQIVNEFKDRIRFEYRHFPLSSIHPNAEDAAKAAEAAGEQGKFWEMHDMLFEHQNEWANVRNPDDQFTEYARIIGIDTDKFFTAYKSDNIRSVVAAYEREARMKGLSSTPTFYIDNTRIENPSGYDAFRQLIISKIGEGAVASSTDASAIPGEDEGQEALPAQE